MEGIDREGTEWNETLSPGSHISESHSPPAPMGLFVHEGGSTGQKLRGHKCRNHLKLFSLNA